MKVFMNEITIFQFNEVCQPNGVQGRAGAGVCGGRPLPLKIFTLKGGSVACCVSIENTHTPVLVNTLYQHFWCSLASGNTLYQEFWCSLSSGNTLYQDLFYFVKQYPLSGHLVLSFVK